MCLSVLVHVPLHFFLYKVFKRVCYLPSCRLSVYPYSGLCWNVMFTPTRGVPSEAKTWPRITHTRLHRERERESHCKRNQRIRQQRSKLREEHSLFSNQRKIQYMLQSILNFLKLDDDCKNHFGRLFLVWVTAHSS